MDKHILILFLALSRRQTLTLEGEKCHRVDERVESNPVNFAHVGQQFPLFTCAFIGSSLGKKLFYHIWLGGGS